MLRLWRKQSGARDAVTETSFMPPLAQALGPELFLTAGFITERRVPRRRADTSGSIGTDRSAIAENAAASKRWRQVPRSPNGPARNSRGIRTLFCWKWRGGTFRGVAARWWGGRT